MDNPFDHIKHLASDISGAGNFWFGVTFLVSTFVYYTVGAIRDAGEVLPVVRRVPVLRRVVREKYPAEYYRPGEDDSDGE